MDKPAPPHPVDMLRSPDGLLICDGRVRLLGYKEAPPADLTPARSCGERGVAQALEAGRYSWCSCGYSARQPFCDDSHRLEENATNRKSYKFDVLEPVMLTLCLCKRTQRPPLCDGSCDHTPATDCV
jgi:CDGSH-type Zn-finger protein